jgi:hypothetical protein
MGESEKNTHCLNRWIDFAVRKSKSPLVVSIPRRCRVPFKKRCFLHQAECTTLDDRKPYGDVQERTGRAIDLPTSARPCDTWKIDVIRAPVWADGHSARERASGDWATAIKWSIVSYTSIRTCESRPRTKAVRVSNGGELHLHFDNSQTFIWTGDEAQKFTQTRSIVACTIKVLDWFFPDRHWSVGVPHSSPCPVLWGNPDARTWQNR